MLTVNPSIEKLYLDRKSDLIAITIKPVIQIEQLIAILKSTFLLPKQFFKSRIIQV